MLKLENVRKNYDRFTLECSLEVQPGCITGLVGQNGAGKSTTFKAILGLIHTDGGRITLLGKDTKALTTADKERVGVVLSNSCVSEYLTVRDTAAMLDGFYRPLTGRIFWRSAAGTSSLWTGRSKNFPPA